MKTYRIVLALVATAAITACPAKIRISLQNASPDDLEVDYDTKLVVVASEESKEFSAFIGSQDLKIITEFACYDYGPPFSGLPGNFYKPGMRHTLSLEIGANFELIIKPYKENGTARISIAGKPCDDDA